MRLIIFGSHGSGKGTQSKKVAAHYKLHIISTGDIIRENLKKNTDLGKLVRTYMDDNKYVPDELMNPIIGHMIKHDGNGFVLDGYPRTVAQVEFLEKLLETMHTKIDVVINLKVPQEELVRRLLERGTKEGRSDDTHTGIKSRMLEYKQKAEPVLEYYKSHSKVIDINGNQEIEKVFKDIKEVLDRIEKMEQTLIILKPDSVRKGLEKRIIERYERIGLKVVKRRELTPTQDMLKNHYSAHVNKPFYPYLEKFMSSGPVVAMVLEGEGAVAAARKATGSTDPAKAEIGTIRREFGDMTLPDDDRIMMNLVHASATKEEAEKEIKIWFG